MLYSIIVGADKRRGSSGRWTKLASFLAGRTGVSRERRKRKRRFREMCLVEMCLIEICLGHSLRLRCRLRRKPCLERKSTSTSARMGWGFGWVLVANCFMTLYYCAQVLTNVFSLYIGCGESHIQVGNLEVWRCHWEGMAVCVGTRAAGCCHNHGTGIPECACALGFM